MDLTESLAKIEQACKKFGVSFAEREKELSDLIHAKEEAYDEEERAQGRNLAKAFAETRMLFDAVLEKCKLLKMGEVPLTQESLAELRQMAMQMNPIVAPLMAETIKRLRAKGPGTPLLEQAEALSEKRANAVNTDGFSTRGLDDLSGIEFEELITRLLGLMGFRAEMTKASGDGGIDIVATLDQPITGGRYLIQCKRYTENSLVGSPTVREFYGALTADGQAVKGILISTSGFSSQAQEFARGLPIELIGRDQLQQLLKLHGLSTDAPVQAQEPKDRAKQLLNLAMKMREQSRHAEAVKLLREASQLQPDNPDVLFWLGLSYEDVGLHDEQIAAMREVVRLRPDFGEAWRSLGNALHAVGNLDAAADAVKKALAIEPDNLYVLMAWGRICREKGDKDGALSTFKKAVKIAPENASGWFWLGLSHGDRNEHTEALAAYREALRIDPNNVPTWQCVFLVYRNLSDRPRMLQALSRLEQLDPPKAREYRRHFL